MKNAYGRFNITFNSGALCHIIPKKVAYIFGYMEYIDGNYKVQAMNGVANRNMISIVVAFTTPVEIGVILSIHRDPY